MPRRRPNPKKKSARKQREADCNSFLDTNHGQAFLHLLDLRQSCPELNPSDALRRRHHFDKSTNSCSFDLSRCSMTALPASIGSWKSSPFPLTGINLSRCTQLTALPEEIGELSALTTLNLSKCSSLDALPATIGELGALRRLDLSYCSSLAALPDSIGELKTLNYLHLAGCVRLIFLPFTLGDLKELKYLMLDDCTSLSALPGTINGLEALDVLSLAGCSSLVLSRDALIRDDILARRDLKLDGDSDHDDSLDGSCDSDDRLCGFTPSECDELLAQGVKPWDADAGAVLAALGGGDDWSSDDSAEMEKIQAVRAKVAAEIDAAVAHQKELQDALDAAREQAIRER